MKRQLVHKGRSEGGIRIGRQITGVRGREARTSGRSAVNRDPVGGCPLPRLDLSLVAEAALSGEAPHRFDLDGNGTVDMFDFAWAAERVGVATAP